MLSRLLPYFSDYKRPALLSPLFILLEVVCELFLPRLMATIIDIGIVQRDMGEIIRSGLLMVLLSVTAMICGVFATRNAATASMGFGANLRRAQFHHIQSFSFANIDQFSSSSLITRLTNDVTMLQNMANMGLRILLRSPVMLIGALVVAISISGKLARIMLVAIPVLALSIGILMKVCHKLFSIFQKKIDGLNDAVQENLISIRTVKSFVRAGFEKTKFKAANDALTAAGLRAAMRIILMQPIMMLIISGSIVMSIWYGGGLVTAGEITTGDLISFTTYIFQILMSVLMLAMVLLNLSRARACAQRIGEVLDATSDIADPAQPASSDTDDSQRGRVEFRDVSFRFKAGSSGDNVLEGIRFTVEPGEVAAVIGGTGTGKSSLVNLIPRFYDALEGQVLVGGQDVREYSLDALRAQIGMVLQTNILFSGTIRENLMWGNPNASQGELESAVKDAQAYDFIMSFPEGFETHVEQGGVNLSGGQKQRLCIARAILKRPSILILDDSTSAVDSATEATIRDSFRRNLKGTTVILIAQRISSVRDADKIILLEDGRVAAIGDHKSLLESNGIYQEIYRSQQGGVTE